jgi:hypothetical protein
MTTEQQLAKAAIESSFKADVGRLFANLVTALAAEGTSAEAVEKATAAFRRGYGQSCLAFEKAMQISGEQGA